MGTRLLFILACLPALAAVEDADTKPKAEAAATVTVTAEASPVELVKTPNPVVVLDAEAIRTSGAKNLGELLSQAFPGQVMSNGGPGTNTSFLLGGARNQDVVVMLDGVRLQDASGVGGVNLNTLGLAGIDRVEVQKGPCSTRFGAEAMGGVVALYTAEGAAKGLSGELAGSLGTRGHREGLAAPAFGWKGGWVRASLYGAREDQSTETENPFRTTSTFLSAGQHLGEDTVVSLAYRNAYAGVPIPYRSIALTGSRANAYVDKRETSSRNEQLVGTLRTAFSATLAGELTLGQALQERQEWNDFSSPVGRREPFESRRNQATGALTWLPTAKAGLGFSADAYEEFAAMSDYSGTGHKDRGAGRHLGLGAEGHLEPQDWLRLTASVRQQWDRQNFVFTQPGGEPELKTSHATWRLGVNAMLGAGFRAYAAGGTGFGLPFLSAVMYNQANGFVPAFGYERLGVEKSRFLQVGADWTRGPWSLRLEASRTTFDNLVYFDMTDFGYHNGQDMRIQGAELGAAYRSAAWGVDAYYRNQEARDMSVPEAQQLQGSATVRRPFQSAGLKAYAVAGDFRFELHHGWSGARYENYGGFPAVIAASKTHFNDLGALATWNLSKAFSLGLRGEHLMQPKWTKSDWVSRRRDFENDGSQIYGFPAQGPVLSLELRYRF